MIKDRIKELAKARNMGLPALEKELGFGNGTILKWDRSDPAANKLKMVADYFNVTVDYLLTGEEKEKPDVSVELSTSQKILIDRVTQMNEDQAARFVKVLDAFLNM